MSATASPLRYPGGKARLLTLTASILRLNGIERSHYVEPFAGGGGLALSLLYEGHVSDIHINDIDPGIAAFWSCVLNRTDAFVDKILETPVTIKEWRRQRSVAKRCDTSDQLALGFANFFLNRTNRSGVIKDAGVIGGLDQAGTYTIDCRFNREDLAKRVIRIAKYKDRIHLSDLDALRFMEKCRRRLPRDSFLFMDPPYYKKGSSLYTNFYRPQDHAELATKIVASNFRWIVTYDDAPQVRRLYRGFRQYLFGMTYSLHEKRIGTELLIASKGLRLPEELRSGQVRPQ